MHRASRTVLADKTPRITQILLTEQTFRLSRTNRVQQKMRSPMVCSVPKKKTA